MGAVGARLAQAEAEAEPPPTLIARGEAIYRDWEERRMWPEGSVSV